MKVLLQITLILAAIALPAAAQSPSVPMQRGISVQLPTAVTAAVVPHADNEDAMVVAVTRDGKVYLRTELVNPAALAGKVRTELAARHDSDVYIKADSHASYGSVVQVVDAIRIAGAHNVTFLARQNAAAKSATLVAPEGLQMVMPAVQGFQ